MRRFFEILKKLILIGGIIAVIGATVPSIAFADGEGDGGGDGGGEQLPDPSDPTP